MRQNPWTLLKAPAITPPANGAWLTKTLARNANCAYLCRHGSPRTLAAFRSQVPLCRYEDIEPEIHRLAHEEDVLFIGRPVAFERTGGSSRGPKLIPYTHDGLLDFQRNILPWLASTVARHQITGQAYFSISPATRAPECIGDIPVGLPDGAYLGEAAGRVLAQCSAVPLAAGTITDVEAWLRFTTQHLGAAHDLELISVWSPTFLLRLLERIPDAPARWPRLKLISCWADGPSRRYAEEIRRLFPQAQLQPKGLLSTEGCVTAPDETDRHALVPHGFYEFAQGEALFLADELFAGASYELILTTASGLYRYRTGDQVRCEGRNAQGRPVLAFVGRDGLTSDLVGEKLNEPLVQHSLEVLPGFALLLPDHQHSGYVLVCDQAPSDAQLRLVEERLVANPQYAYARALGQLAPLRVLRRPHAAEVHERALLARGTRLGDLKPVSLRTEPFWLPLFEESPP